MDMVDNALDPTHFQDSAAFSNSYPLALRILTLVALGTLAWATNLHFLALLGIDTGSVLDVRLSDSSLNPHHYPAAHPSRLYPPVYVLAGALAAWTSIGMGVYTLFGTGETSSLHRLLPGTFLLLAIVACVFPWERLQKRERFMFLRSLRRTVFDHPYATVPFSDVILADILTSYAKVLGDLWVCVGLLAGTDARAIWGGRGRWGVPIMTALPYIFRFRQCISEFLNLPPHSYSLINPSTPTAPTPSNPRSRSLLNALKYASAFPVIALSALQGDRSDMFHSAEASSPDPRSMVIFRLWIVSVLFNSLYSFWWDVTNDWGLWILVPSACSNRAPAQEERRLAPLTPPLRLRQQPIKSLSSRQNTPTRKLEEGDPPPSPSHSLRASSSRILRQNLLLSDPLVYYLAISVDLLLRLTWSLKLSSHLHSIHEIEQGVFLIESLEVLRRWMWVFLRMEWETVRRSSASDVEEMDAKPDEP